MSGSGRVTLNDVAAASGVSRATVSFVLNDDPNQTISAATRERVQQAARELGYAPHGLARALREGSSRVVVLNIDWGLEGNYSRSFVRGLDSELASHDHVLLVRHAHHTPRSTRQVIDAITPARSFNSPSPIEPATTSMTVAAAGRTAWPPTPPCRSVTWPNTATRTSPWPCRTPRPRWPMSGCGSPLGLQSTLASPR